MTVKQIVDFCLTERNDKVRFTLEMVKGLKGRERVLTREEVYKFIEGYENCEVLTVDYEKASITHFTREEDKVVKWEIPVLHIVYEWKNERSQRLFFYKK